MNIKCRIGYVNNKSNNKYAIIEILDKEFNFKLTKNSKLGGITIRPYFEDVRATDKNGNSRINVFGVRFDSDIDVSNLKINNIVDLTDVELLENQ